MLGREGDFVVKRERERERDRDRRHCELEGEGDCMSQTEKR